MRSFLVLVFLIIQPIFAASLSEDQKLESIILEFLKHNSEQDTFWSPVNNSSVTDFSSLGDYYSKDFEIRISKNLSKAQNEFRKVRFALLSESRKVDYFLFDESIRIRAASAKVDYYRYFVFTSDNRAASLVRMANPSENYFPFKTQKNYYDFLSRMNQFNKYGQQMVNRESEGLKRGFIGPCAELDNAIHFVKMATKMPVEENPFYLPIKNIPPEWSDSDKAKLTNAFEKSIQNDIIPTYRTILNFLENTYKPVCRPSEGMSHKSGGAEAYRIEIAKYTGQFYDPNQIYELGLKEVARIQKEYAKIKGQFGFHGTDRDFFKYINSQPNAYYSSSEELVDDHSRMLKLIETKLSKVFSLVPKTTYEVQRFNYSEFPFPHYIPPYEGNEVGLVRLPADNIKSMPRYEVTALMLHEGIPGHHFQYALEYENKTIPKFRQEISQTTAFIEGWGLYAESLGFDLDLYSEQMQKFGYLAMQMYRATRLVVDTGLNYKGWSRQQAIDYMKDFLPNQESDLADFAERYVAIPGQAIAYKIGELKILELRSYAKNKLGSKFDIKEFHRLTLESGAVSLRYLEYKIKNWVEPSGIAEGGHLPNELDSEHLWRQSMRQ